MRFGSFCNPRARAAISGVEAAAKSGVVSEGRLNDSALRSAVELGPAAPETVPGPTRALPLIQPGGDSEFWAWQTALAISRLTKIVNRDLFIVSPCSIRILLHVAFAIHVHGLAPRSGEQFQSSGGIIRIVDPRAR